MPPAIARQSPFADQVTHFLVHFFVEGKFYSIFSFLFGFGFALQIARAEERGDSRASLFKRRLFWLLVIGLLHAYLLWSGDILSIYAVMGLVLILFRKKTNVRVAQVGVRSVGNSNPDLHSALHFVCRLCPARCVSEAGCSADQFTTHGTSADYADFTDRRSATMRKRLKGVGRHGLPLCFLCLFVASYPRSLQNLLIRLSGDHQQLRQSVHDLRFTIQFLSHW